MAKPMRRVFSGHDASGRSIILEDGASPHVLEWEGVPGLAVTTLWSTQSSPASNAGSQDPVAKGYATEPPAGGSVFRVVDMPPDDFYRQQKVAMGADYVESRGPGRHPGMHQTNSVDYAIVMEGEVWALMEEDEILLRAGDSFIQRGTNHAWSNRTDSPCRIAFVLVPADPV